MGRSNFSKHLYGLFIFICIICALLTSLAGKAMAQATAWSEAMGLTAQRYDHTATLLTNGQVLVAGGWYDPTFPLAESEIYDPNTGTGGTWTATTASLNIGRAYHTATLLANGPASTNGMVLVVGGQDISNNAISITELYNPASGPTTGTWTETSAGLATGRYYHTATLLNNGNVLVTGGVDTNGNVLQSSEIFNPSTSTWSPGPNLNTARYNHEASLLSNGNVLVSGGQDINGNALSSCEIYNPSTSAWTKTGNLTTPRYYHTATSLNINQVLAAGGWDASSDILATSETYNPSTGTWTAAGPLALARIAHTATLLSGGKVLVAGGIGNQTSGNQSLEISDSEVYDPSTRSWTVTGNLITARSDHTATLLNNGNVLVAGGLGETGTTFSELTDCELYNSTVVASVPGVPQSVTAAPGNGQATVSFTAPASNGGSSITGYTAISSGGQKATGSATATSITVTGLTNGNSYTFTVTATNANGTGPASLPSNAVTPAGFPVYRRMYRQRPATPRQRSVSRRPPPAAEAP